MGHSSYYYLGILAGIIVGIIVVAISKRIKNGGKKCEYDERQTAARGKAFKYGFFSLIAYLVLYGIIQDMTGVYWGKGMVGVSLGICISIAVFAVISIWNDAYFSLWENPRQYVITFSAAFAINIMAAVPIFLHGKKDMDYAYINLFLAVTLFIVLVTIVLKFQKDKREGDE